MESIRLWLSCAAVVAVVSGVTTLLSPDGALKKYVKYLGALTVLLVLALPLTKNLTADFPELDGIFESDNSGEVDAEGSYRELLRRESEEAIKSELDGYFNVDCEVELSISEDCEPLECKVTLPEVNKIYAAMIEIRAGELAGCDAKVVLTGAEMTLNG